LFLKFSKFFPQNLNSFVLFKILEKRNRTLMNNKETFFFLKNLIYSLNFSKKNQIAVLYEENFFTAFFKNFNDYLIFIEIFSILKNLKPNNKKNK